MVTWPLPSTCGKAEPGGGDHVIEQRGLPKVARKEIERGREKRGELDP